jgi:PAS domain S-box-containing protein
MGQDPDITPFDQKLFLVFITTFAAMTAFEFTGQYLYPYPPDWRSNIITALFTSGISVVIAYFPLRSYYNQNVRTLTEIEKRVLIEKELREREERLRRMFDQSPIGVAVVSLENRFTHVNGALAHITGYSPEELVQKTCADVTYPDDIARDLEMTGWLKDGAIEQYDADKRFVRKDGSTIWVHVSTRLIRDSGGAPLYYLPMIVDINDRKMTEEAFKKANTKLNILSAVTRHDIKNRLTGLIGFMNLLREKIPEDPVLLGYLQKQAECADDILRQIEFSQYYENLGVEAAKWYEVRSVIRNAAEQLPMEGIALDYGDRDVWIYADPLIEKAFYNLMENSIRHGKHVTELSFGFTESEGTLLMTYTDNGIGISSGEREKIFDRGFGSHTGLGLFLIREILAITGITIAENGTPGSGARFVVSVPKSRYRAN